MDVACGRKKARVAEESLSSEILLDVSYWICGCGFPRIDIPVSVVCFLLVNCFVRLGLGVRASRLCLYPEPPQVLT